MIEKQCNFCNAVFEIFPCREKNSSVNFCNKDCKKKYTKLTNESPITIEFLNKTINYDPITGIFTWRSIDGSYGKRVPGEQVGYPHRKGYWHCEIRGKFYQLHRLAWFITYGAWPKDQIDHINGIKSDNSINNLREASNGQNQQNIGVRKSSKSGIKGVVIAKNCTKNPYHAQITFNKKVINLGYFETIEEAHRAYDDAAKIYHGEFYKS